MMQLLLLAVIGALIGWMTNVLAIRLLFRPIHPLRIPLTPFVLQGLIPKRKGEIAESIGDVVGQELLSAESIVDHILEKTDKNELVQTVKLKILSVAEERLSGMIPSIFRGKILQAVERTIDENGELMITELGHQLSHKAIESLDVARMVTDQIHSFDVETLEQMTLKIARAELKHIEVLGGIIGFLIGVIQGVLVLYIF